MPFERKNNILILHGKIAIRKEYFLAPMLNYVMASSWTMKASHIKPGSTVNKMPEKKCLDFEILYCRVLEEVIMLYHFDVILFKTGQPNLDSAKSSDSGRRPRRVWV